ncbi:hypothetical protein ACCO45_000549 [Purpureocillium lilacinum]|uniref:Uncharacterized protein n=1 Tax=Purpureocillium lilacinum TaxID=33203 RepID=A0ACC4E7A8_PURLI
MPKDRRVPLVCWDHPTFRRRASESDEAIAGDALSAAYGGGDRAQLGRGGAAPGGEGGDLRTRRQAEQDGTSGSEAVYLRSSTRRSLSFLVVPESRQQSQLSQATDWLWGWPDYKRLWSHTHKDGHTQQMMVMLTPKEPSHPPNRPSFADGPSLALARDQGAPSFVHGRPLEPPRSARPPSSPVIIGVGPPTRRLVCWAAGLLGCWAAPFGPAQQRGCAHSWRRANSPGPQKEARSAWEQAQTQSDSKVSKKQGRAIRAAGNGAISSGTSGTLGLGFPAYSPLGQPTHWWHAVIVSWFLAVAPCPLPAVLRSSQVAILPGLWLVRDPAPLPFRYARAQDQLDPKDVSLKVVPWLDVTVASTTVGWLRAVACNTRTSPQPVRVTKYRAIRRHSSPRPRLGLALASQGTMVQRVMTLGMQRRRQLRSEGKSITDPRRSVEIVPVGALIEIAGSLRMGALLRAFYDSSSTSLLVRLQANSSPLAVGVANDSGRVVQPTGSAWAALRRPVFTHSRPIAKCSVRGHIAMSPLQHIGILIPLVPFVARVRSMAGHSMPSYPPSTSALPRTEGDDAGAGVAPPGPAGSLVWLQARQASKQHGTVATAMRMDVWMSGSHSWSKGLPGQARRLPPSPAFFARRSHVSLECQASAETRAERTALARRAFQKASPAMPPREGALNGAGSLVFIHRHPAATIQSLREIDPRPLQFDSSEAGILFSRPTTPRASHTHSTIAVLVQSRVSNYPTPTTRDPFFSSRRPRHEPDVRDIPARGAARSDSARERVDAACPHRNGNGKHPPAEDGQPFMASGVVS